MTQLFSKSVLGAVVIIALFVPPPALAAFIAHFDEPSFSTAVSALPDPISATEAFDGFAPLPPGGIPAPCDPLSSGCGAVAPGISYTSGGSGLVIVDFNLFNFTEALGTTALTDSLSITINGGGTALGFTLINDDFDGGFDDIAVTIDVFDSAMGSVGSFPVSVSFAMGSAFFGVTATGGDFIGGLSITPIGTESPLLDGMSFNTGLAPAAPIPEPAILGLMALALGLLPMARYRRKTATV